MLLLLQTHTDTVLTHSSTDVFSDTAFWNKLISIEAAFGTAGAVFIILVVTGLFQEIFDKNPRIVALITSVLLSTIMLFLSGIHGFLYSVLTVVLNSLINMATTWTVLELAARSRIRESTPKFKRSRKKIGSNTDQPNGEIRERRHFFTSWFE